MIGKWKKIQPTLTCVMALHTYIPIKSKQPPTKNNEQLITQQIFT